MAPIEPATLPEATAAPTTEDERWMQQCLEMAAHGAGRVSPNPMVGALLVGADGTVLGEGWHQEYGGPHAEPRAVEDAEQQHGADALKEATLYVNLEPCSHHGKTPPCADLVLRKEIPRVVAGMEDPNPQVGGRSIRRLRSRGVDVRVGVLEKQCRRLNEAFVHHMQTGRPLVTLKVAATLDGRVATSTGDARWVSGPASRTLVHRWRAALDGVLVGSGTARADDPALTVRRVEGRQPARFVLDRPGTLPPDLQLFSDAFARHTVAVVGEHRDAPAYARSLEQAGGCLLRLPEEEEHLSLEGLLEVVGRNQGSPLDRPLQSLLVEAGPGLATALLRQDLVDRFCLFVAPKLLGRGVPLLEELGIKQMSDAYTFAESTWQAVGDDILFQGYRRAM